MQMIHQLTCSRPILLPRPAGDALVQLLEVHPKLLTFSAAADSKALQKGAARASIDLVERQVGTMCDAARVPVCTRVL